MERTIKTIADALDYAALKYPDKIAYAFLENNEIIHSISYKQLQTEVYTLAAKLTKQINKGNRVGLLFAPGIDFVKTFIAVLLSGNIAVPIYPPQTKEAALQLQNILEDCQPKICITTKNILQKIKRLGFIKKFSKIPFINFLLQKQMSVAQKQMLSAKILKLESLNWITLENINKKELKAKINLRVQPDDIAYLQYTSGSTGNPKGVIITHSNIIHTISVNQYHAEVTDQDISLSWVPHYHNIGLIVGLFAPLCSQATAYLMSPLEVVKNPSSWLAAISRYRVSITGGPNFIFQKCTQEIPELTLKQLDLSCWKIAFCGGEQIHIETLDAFAEQFAICGFDNKAFFPAYGLAEATVYVMGSYRSRELLKVAINNDFFKKNQIIISDKMAHDKIKWLVAGRVDGEDHKVIVVDPLTKKKLLENQIGEIWIKSLSVGKGYWQKPEETQAMFAARLEGEKELYLRTGDLGFLHAKTLVVCGRDKELIIIRGHNYYPFDIESCIEENFSEIESGSVVAISVPIQQEEALILLIEEPLMNNDSLFNLIRQVLANRLGIVPYHICMIPKESIAKTPSAKKKRKLMRQRYLDSQLKILNEWRSNQSLTQINPNQKTELQEYIRQWLSHHTAVTMNEIDFEKNLSFYGLDSLAMMNFLNDLEKAFSISNLNPVILYEFNTLQALVDYIVSLPVTKKTENMQHSTEEPIAIIGMACRMPGAESVSEFWQLLSSGQDAVQEVTEHRKSLGLQFDENDIHFSAVNRIGLIKDVDGFDNEFFAMSKHESDYLCPQQRMLLECSWHALEHAGILPAALSESDTSIFIGLSTCDYRTLIDEQEIETSSVFVSTGTALSAAAGRLAYFYNTKGKALVIDTACSSSLVALDNAIQEIKNGRSRMAIVGAANMILTPHNSLHFAKANMLAKDGLCKTFDESADGYVRGEGAGVVILKRLSDAEKDGDTILGIIRGSLVNQDGYSNGLAAPNSQSQVNLLQETLQRSQFSKNDIDYFEVHGTGTVLGDPIEINSISKVYSDRENPLHIGSVKTVVGHLEAAAGMASLIKVLLSFKAKQLPPHLNVKKLNSYLSLEKIPANITQNLMEWPTQQNEMRAAINSFGFTGTNAHILIESYSQSKSIVQEKNSRSYLICISAKSMETLNIYIENYISFLNSHPSIDLKDFAYTLNCKRTHFRHRIVVIAHTVIKLIEKLNTKDYRGTIITEEKNGNVSIEDCHENFSEAYLKGMLIDFEKLPQHVTGKKIDLLFYPFNRKSSWINLKENKKFGPISEKNQDNWKSLADIERSEKINLLLTEEIKSFLAIDKHELISDEQGFMELGLDSMQLIELSRIVQRKLGIEVDPFELFEYKNIQQLTKYLSQNFISIPKLGLHKTEVKLTQNQQINEVAIIGMGCRFPGGINNPELLWDLLKKGEDALDISVINRTAYKDELGGFLEQVEYFDAKHFGISPREAVCIDPQQRILLEVIWESLVNSGISPENLKNTNTGVFVGISSNDYNQCLRQSDLTPGLHLSTGNSSSVASGRISYLLGLKGPCLSLDTACSSSLVATHLACQSIKQGECDLAIVAGVNLILESAHSDNLKAANMLSPDGRCKSFDSEANGFVRSEGCGVIILANKNSGYAKNVLAVIKGSAVNQDGHSSGLTAPNIEAQKEVITLALENASVKGDEVDYLEAHGSGTLLGDPIELNAIRDTYTPRNTLLKIGAIKSSIGHTEAVSGIAGLIKVVLALQYQQLPPQANFVKKNQQIKFTSNEAEILTELTPWVTGGKQRIAGVSSFGFSGTNCHMIISEVESGIQPVPYRTYPFEREYFWCEQKSSVIDQFVPVKHPILNKRTVLADESIIYSGDVNLKDFPYLIDHDIFSYVLLPGSVFCDLALAVAKEEFQSVDISIHEIKFLEALNLSTDQIHLLQIIVKKTNSGLVIDIFSKKPDDAKWIIYCKARCNQDENSLFHFNKWSEAQLDKLFSANDFYQTMNANGIFYGNAFKVIKNIKYADNLVAVEIEGNQNLRNYIAHPTMLDGCFQTGVTLSVIMGSIKPQEAYIPFSIEKIMLYQKFPRQIKVIAEVQKQSTHETMMCDLWIMDSNSIPIAYIKGLVGKRVNLNILTKQFYSKKQLTYQTIWKEENLLQNNGMQEDIKPEYQLGKKLNHLGNVIILSDHHDHYAVLKGIIENKSLTQQHYPIQNYNQHIQGDKIQCPDLIIIIDDYSHATEENIFKRLQDIRILLQCLLNNQQSIPKLVYLYQSFNDNLLIDPAFNTVNSFVRSISLEYPRFKYLTCHLNLDVKENHKNLLHDIKFVNNENLQYKQQQRYVTRLKPFVLNKLEKPFSIDRTGSYLITGGMGALGQQLANWLIQNGAKYIILIGRSIKNTNEILFSDQNVKVCKLILDITDANQVNEFIDSFEKEHPPLKGIIHAAGVLQDSLFNTLSKQQFAAVWQAKVHGLMHLDQALNQNNISLDFFITCSSIAAVLGSPGQSHYAAANAMVDAFVAQCRAEGKPYISINWGPWEGSGMAAQWNKQYRRVGVEALTAAENLSLFTDVLTNSVANTANITNIAIMQIDFHEYLNYFKNNEIFLSLLKSSIKVRPASLTHKITQSPAKRHLKIISDFIKHELQQVLNASDASLVAMDVGFFDMGLDSLMLLEFQERLQNGIGDAFELANTVGFDYPTPTLLAEKIYELYNNKNVITDNKNVLRHIDHIIVKKHTEKSLNELIKMIDDE